MTNELERRPRSADAAFGLAFYLGMSMRSGLGPFFGLAVRLCAVAWVALTVRRILCAGVA